MNYLITGFPGMGKSTIAGELKKRGHTAYDPEVMQTYMHTVSRLTGKHIPVPSEIPLGWYDTVGAYNWNPLKIEHLLDLPGDIFICSKAHNQEIYYNKFQLIFVLTLDITELAERLNARPGKTIGKTTSELSDILSLHQHFEQSLLNRGAIRINTAQPLTEVVDLILSYVD